MVYWNSAGEEAVVLDVQWSLPHHVRHAGSDVSLGFPGLRLDIVSN